MKLTEKEVKTLKKFFETLQYSDLTDAEKKIYKKIIVYLEEY